MTPRKARESSRTLSSVKGRLAIFSIAACVLASGCGVQMGQEKIDEARQAKKQAENSQHKLEKKLEEGQ